MTHDEWQKARVDAAEKTWWDSDSNETSAAVLERCLKAADAVPMPGEEELLRIAERTYRDAYYALPNIYEAMKDVIAALRPWVAAMIEKGK